MERERYQTEDEVERDLPRVTPPVYGETDTDPNREDQRDAHRADSEQHV